METSVNECQWQQWVRANSAKLLLFARQKARNEADAQDLVQEAVMEVSSKCGGGPPPVTAVFGTIRLRAIDLARRNERRLGREQTLLARQTEPWFDVTAEDREMKTMLEQALRQLPEIYREVVTLRIWGGLTFAEIGEALQISQNTIASRYRYALEELRKLTKGVLA
jgi:RNA polymerase sigma-70 factor, ECF subfamily